MTALPRPSAAEARDIAAYDALMWALARPGTVRFLPEPGAACLASALLDRECAVYCADAALGATIAATGAVRVDLEAADHAFLGPLTDAATLARLPCGSDLHPEGGATAIIDVRIGDGPTLRLSGPGIEDDLTVEIGGLPAGIWRVRAQAARYPMGFEMILIDRDRILGLPRTTCVEVL